MLVFPIDLNAGGQSRSYPGALPPSDSDAACRELIDIGALTITFADVRPIGQTADKSCHVRGSVQPGIRYHVDLPLPSKWNGRFIGFGDPGSDGIIFSSNPFIKNRVQEGYAVVNSNSGHDEPPNPARRSRSEHHSSRSEAAEHQGAPGRRGEGPRLRVGESQWGCPVRRPLPP